MEGRGRWFIISFKISSTNMSVGGREELFWYLTLRIFFCRWVFIGKVDRWWMTSVDDGLGDVSFLGFVHLLRFSLAI